LAETSLEPGEACGPGIKGSLSITRLTTQSRLTSYTRWDFLSTNEHKL